MEDKRAYLNEFKEYLKVFQSLYRKIKEFDDYKDLNEKILQTFKNGAKAQNYKIDKAIFGIYFILEVEKSTLTFKNSILNFTLEVNGKLTMEYEKGIFKKSIVSETFNNYYAILSLSLNEETGEIEDFYFHSESEGKPLTKFLHAQLLFMAYLYKELLLNIVEYIIKKEEEKNKEQKIEEKWYLKK